MARSLGQQACADSSRVGHASCGDREVVERVQDARLSFEKLMSIWSDLLSDEDHCAAEIANSIKGLYNALEHVVCPTVFKLRLEAAAEHDALIDALEILDEAFWDQPDPVIPKVDEVLTRLYDFREYYDLDAAEALAEEARSLWYSYCRKPVVEQHADGFDLEQAIRHAIALRTREV